MFLVSTPCSCVADTYVTMLNIVGMFIIFALKYTVKLLSTGLQAVGMLAGDLAIAIFQAAKQAVDKLDTESREPPKPAEAPAPEAARGDAATEEGEAADTDMSGIPAYHFLLCSLHGLHLCRPLRMRLLGLCSEWSVASLLYCSTASRITAVRLWFQRTCQSHHW
jgi:hypothetical protein